MAHSQSLVSRMVRAAKLDVDLYEEVEHDTSANKQAFAAVLIVSLAAGIGAGIGGVLDDDGGLSFLWGLLIGVGTGVVGWLLWAAVTLWIGTTIFKTRETEANYGQMLRTLGFATSPGVLVLFAFIPILGAIIQFVASIWRLVAGVIAVRQALDFSTWRAIGTVLVGWIVYIILGVLVGWLVLGTSILF